MGTTEQLVGNTVCEFVIKWMGNGMAHEVKLEKTHIIGNGNSAKLFEDDGSMSIVACNIPQHGHRYTHLSIIDSQPVVWMSNTGWQPSVPVLCNKRAYNTAERYNIGGDWQQVYDDLYRSNSGHWAAWHIIKQPVKEIHLWGMDSMFSDDLTSQMDTIVKRPQRPKLNQHWHPHWQDVFAKGQHIKWYLHTPENVEPLVVADNLTQITHKTHSSTEIL